MWSDQHSIGFLVVFCLAVVAIIIEYYHFSLRREIDLEAMDWLQCVPFDGAIFEHIASHSTAMG